MLRTLKVSAAKSKQKKHIPIIVCQGYWVKSLGFEIGSQVEIEERLGEIVIRLCKQDQQQEQQED